jgi:tellurite methyltransferase
MPTPHQHKESPAPLQPSVQPDEQDRQRWNQIYSDGSHRALEPDASFVDLYRRFVSPTLPADDPAHAPKRALDVAGGVGRNAQFLAREGWQVTLNELSDEAVHLAEESARRAGLSLTTHRESALTTLTRAREENTRYDLILMLFYLDRSLFPLLPSALTPGGMLLVKTRTEDHPRFHAGSHHPEYFLRRGELRQSLPRLEVLHYEESGGMAELLAVHP